MVCTQQACESPRGSGRAPRGDSLRLSLGCACPDVAVWAAFRFRACAARVFARNSHRRSFSLLCILHIAVLLNRAMSDLRRRIFGVGTPDSTPSSSRDNSPAPARPGDKVTDYKIVPAKQAEKASKQKQRGRKRRNVWIFGLGGLFGILAAGFFA